MLKRFFVHSLIVVCCALAAHDLHAQWLPTNAADGDPITHSGNVAIGATSTPSDSIYMLKILGSDNHKAILAKTTSGLYAAWLEASANDVCKTRLQSNGTNGFAGTMTNHPFSFVVNSAEKARFDTTGYFGVGTAAPISSLHQYSNTANNPTTAAITGSGWDGLLTLNAGAFGNAGGGGGVVFGGNNAGQYFAAIKSLLANGGGNTTGDLAFSTRGATGDPALTERLRLTADGKLGMGVQLPLSSLQQYSNTANNPTTAALTGSSLDGLLTLNAGAIGAAGGGGGIVFGGFGQAQYFAAVKALLTNGAGNTTGDLAFSTRNTTSDAALTEQMRLTAGGQLVVGAPSVAGHTSEKLVVSGDAYFTGTVKGGNIQAQYQDVAEWVPADADLPAGTVVIVKDDSLNTVAASTSAYDTRVAGVVSAQPGIVLGVEDRSKAKIATTGRVKVRVDASRGPIRAGDLLVTSDKPGEAMRSEPVDVAGVRMHRPGTLIGKALEPLSSGQGEILVLLSLQ